MKIQKKFIRFSLRKAVRIILNQAGLISTVICFGLLITAANHALSAEKKAKIKSDVSKNATWSGGVGKEAGRDDFLGTCSPCHGESGRGDGPLSDTLGLPEGIKPRNLTDSKLLSNRTDEDLFNVIKNGGASIGLSEVMPSQKETFTDEDIRNIVLFIRSDLCKCQYKGKGGK